MSLSRYYGLYNRRFTHSAARLRSMSTRVFAVIIHTCSDGSGTVVRSAPDGPLRANSQMRYNSAT